MTEHLINRPAVLARCPRCGHYCLIAISGGLAIRTDAASVTVTQEIAARLTGRTTFDVVVYGGRMYLEWRHLIRVRGDRCYPVVAAHPCQATVNYADPKTDRIRPPSPAEPALLF